MLDTGSDSFRRYAPAAEKKFSTDSHDTGARERIDGATELVDHPPLLRVANLRSLQASRKYGGCGLVTMRVDPVA